MNELVETKKRLGLSTPPSPLLPGYKRVPASFVAYAYAYAYERHLTFSPTACQAPANHECVLRPLEKAAAGVEGCNLALLTP